MRPTPTGLRPTPRNSPPTPPAAAGETCFEWIGRCFTPQAGLALAWNNLHASGAPNHDTLHEAMPILAGSKYVLTKWCRTRR